MFFNDSHKYFYGVVMTAENQVDWIRPFPNKEMRDTWVGLEENRKAMSAQEIGPTKCEFARNSVLKLLIKHQGVLAIARKQLHEFDYEGEYRVLASGRKAQLMISQLEKGGIKLTEAQVEQIKKTF